jgi:hypothetical protein
LLFLKGMSLWSSEPIQPIEVRLVKTLILSLLLIYMIARTFEYVHTARGGDRSSCGVSSCSDDFGVTRKA